MPLRWHAGCALRTRRVLRHGGTSSRYLLAAITGPKILAGTLVDIRGGPEILLTRSFTDGVTLGMPDGAFRAKSMPETHAVHDILGGYACRRGGHITLLLTPRRYYFCTPGVVTDGSVSFSQQGTYQPAPWGVSGLRNPAGFVSSG